MQKPRVLIVDDEPDIADALALVLDQSGHETATAENGSQALERLHGGFDASVILLDLMMPIMDGESFMAEQRRDPRLVSIPVILFSGDYRRLAAAQGPNVIARLRKPVALSPLLEAVRRGSANRRSQSPSPPF